MPDVLHEIDFIAELNFYYLCLATLIDNFICIVCKNCHCHTKFNI